MNLARLLQLLNVCRTIRLEQDLSRLTASSVSLAASTERLVRVLTAPPIREPDAIDAVIGMAARGSVMSNLVEIQRLMSTGQVKDAKLMVDALVLVSKAEAS